MNVRIALSFAPVLDETKTSFLWLISCECYLQNLKFKRSTEDYSCSFFNNALVS